MPAQRKKQPPPQPSDYETDAPPIDIPPPAPRSNYDLNLSVIRRHFTNTLTLHHVSPYAVLYTFSLATSQWEKVGIEGTLFIIQLTNSPLGAERYGVVILNRRGLENFHQELRSEEEVEISEEYIILHGGADVVGLWIFSEDEGSTKGMRLETQEKILELTKAAAASRAKYEAGQEAEEKNGTVAEESEAEGGVPMGRQVSLRELFGQQRAQDAGWSVHGHNGEGNTAPVQPQEQTRQQVQMNLLDQMFMSARHDYNGVG